MTGLVVTVGVLGALLHGPAVPSHILMERPVSDRNLSREHFVLDSPWALVFVNDAQADDDL